jgi:hypothetical protein
MAGASRCPHAPHRGSISRACLAAHAAQWAARQSIATPITDQLINEWARADNQIIARPKTTSAGRYGRRGDWPVLGSYRRLLVALRLREQGVNGTRELRLLLAIAGYGGDPQLLPGDLHHTVDALARRIRRELALPPENLSDEPPLRLRRYVAQLYPQLHGLAVPGLTDDQNALLRGVVADPEAQDLLLRYLDLMVRGARPAVVRRLRQAARRIPLPADGDIVEAVRPLAAILSPADDGTNDLLEDLQRATPADVLYGIALLRWLPAYILWTEMTAGNAPSTDPAERFALEVGRILRRVLPLIPLRMRPVLVGIFTVQLVRYREGTATWAPGLPQAG